MRVDYKILFYFEESNRKEFDNSFSPGIVPFHCNRYNSWELIYVTGKEVNAVLTNPAVERVSSWDEDGIADLYRAGGWSKDESRVEEIRHLVRGRFAFAVVVDKGTSRVLSDGVSDDYVQDLMVLPQYRKTGAGTQIVTALATRCLQTGITWIGLTAESDTEKFYLTPGFHPMERRVPLIFRSES